MPTCACCTNEAKIYHGRQSRFCSNRCRASYYRTLCDIKSHYPGLPNSTVGAINELRVAADLLTQGFDVFRAMSPSCSCDLAVIKNGSLLRIEVRTAYRNRLTGKCTSSKNPPGVDRHDHYAFVLPDEIIYDPPLPKDLVKQPLWNKPPTTPLV